MMIKMFQRLILATLCLQAFHVTLMEAAKQHVQLSDSYLPVAMQVIANLVDQMAFEVKEEPGPKPLKPTTKPPTTAKPLYVNSDYFWTLKPRSLSWWMLKPRSLWWWMLFDISRDVTTPFHRPGYYAPASPPKPSERLTPQAQQLQQILKEQQQQFNIPIQNQQQYNPLQNQQQYNIPQPNQQQYDVPQQNHQQYNIPPQNQQEYGPQLNQQQNVPSQTQQLYNVPLQSQQEHIPQLNQQQYNIPQPKQQQYDIPQQNHQLYNIPPQNQQEYGPQPNQQQNIPQHNQQQYAILPENQQQYNIPPQNQKYYIPQQNFQGFNLSQHYHGNTFSQNYKYFEQNPNLMNKNFDVMTFDFPQYNPIQPQDVRNEEPLLSAHHAEVKPLLEPKPDTTHLLPPHFETEVDKISSRSKDYDLDELSQENLQYLSQDVREMIRMAHDPYDERLVDVWEGLRAHPAEPSPKGKLSSSNLRLLLLYDLLSREAKRLRLSDYSGFSPDVMKNLVESSGGGARAQLSMALSKMVERHDCGHEYANNRAKEMVVELGKDESKLSSEIRYLQPLIYRY